MFLRINLEKFSNLIDFFDCLKNIFEHRHLSKKIGDLYLKVTSGLYSAFKIYPNVKSNAFNTNVIKMWPLTFVAQSFYTSKMYLLISCLAYRDLVHVRLIEREVKKKMKFVFFVRFLLILFPPYLMRRKDSSDLVQIFALKHFMSSMIL